MQVSERQLRPYEGVVIMHADASDEEQKALFKRNKGIVESFKGSLKHVDTWGKRNLGNSIAGSRKALYFHTTFEAAPEAIAELERTMRINDRVLRFMHTRLKDGTNLSTHVENFKKALAESAQREREREAKFQARKAAQGGRGGRDGGGFRRRDDEGGGGGRGGFGRGGGDEGGDDMGGDEGEI